MARSWCGAADSSRAHLCPLIWRATCLQLATCHVHAVRPRHWCCQTIARAWVPLIPSLAVEHADLEPRDPVRFGLFPLRAVGRSTTRRARSELELGWAGWRIGVPCRTANEPVKRPRRLPRGVRGTMWEGVGGSGRDGEGLRRGGGEWWAGGGSGSHSPSFNQATPSNPPPKLLPTNTSHMP